MNNNLKEVGLFHGCKIYIDTSDEIVFKLFLLNFSGAMQKHYGLPKTDEEMIEELQLDYDKSEQLQIFRLEDKINQIIRKINNMI
jgi:hypothetical protein